MSNPSSALPGPAPREPQETIPRYRWWLEGVTGLMHCDRHEAGEWVKWSDVDSALQQAQATIQRLAQERESLKAAATLAMNSLTVIDRSRRAPIDEPQRRAVAELQRVITVCREALLSTAERPTGSPIDAERTEHGEPPRSAVLGMAVAARVWSAAGASRREFIALAEVAWDRARDDGSTPNHPRVDGSYGYPQSEGPVNP